MAGFRTKLIDVGLLIGIILSIGSYFVLDSAIYTMPIVLDDGEKLGSIQCILPDWNYELRTVGNCEKYCQENLTGSILSSSTVDGELYDIVCVRTISTPLPPTTVPPPTLPPTTAPPTTAPPTTVPPTTGPPPKPTIILNPLPPGYTDKYEISAVEYSEQRFPTALKTYSLGLVGEYGKATFKIFERNKKIYAFEFENESAAEEFFIQFEGRVKRHEPDPKTLEITPVIVHFRYTNTGDYNGAYFRLENRVYYLKMEFFEPTDLQFIKENFLGLEFTASPTGTATSALEYYELERLIFDLVNLERSNYNLSNLTWDNGIANVARKHSGDMGTKNYFSHDSLDGRKLKDRFMEEEIPCISGCGENIIMHPEALRIKIINDIAYPDYLTQEELAKGIVKSWMESPAHKENILTDWFKTAGMGLYYANSYYYVTQNFKG